MLSVFPDLLYPFFAPTLLRVVVACFFFYVAYQQYARRQEIAAVQFSAFVPLAIIFHLLVGAMFLFGYYTQVAAMVAIAGLVVGWWLNRKHPSVVILPNSTVFLLIAVCASFILSGPGAWGRDLPL